MPILFCRHLFSAHSLIHFNECVDDDLELSPMCTYTCTIYALKVDNEKSNLILEAIKVEELPILTTDQFHSSKSCMEVRYAIVVRKFDAVM